MPGDDGPTRRLDALLEELLSDHPTDASITLTRLSRLLSPQTNLLAQARIARRLRAALTLTSDVAVRAACVMSMAGVPAHRVLHFLSASLPGTVSLAQFELAVRFMFNDDPPLSQQLLYDLTQYPYLEKKLLSQRSVEVASRLTGTLSPRLLLFLYFLSLRDDLSNENVHLILLILRLCFPALKVRGRSGSISRDEEREVAEAWKSAQKSARYAEILPVAGTGSRAEGPGSRDSASYFLDKYYADSAPVGQAAPREEPANPAVQRLSFVRTTGRGGVARGAQVAGQKRPRRKNAAAPRRRPPQRRTVAPAAEETAPAAAAPLGQAPKRAAGVPWFVPWLAPFCLAAAVLVALFFGARPDQVARVPASPPAVHLPAQPSAPPATAARPAVAAQPEGSQSQPASRLSARVVQRGDSLWKIYRSLHSDGTVAGEWKDFLRLMKDTNALPNPDRIYPGNVLSITTGGK